jgi:hypothetical protein
MPNGRHDAFTAVIRTSWGVSVYGTGYDAEAALRKAVSRVPGMGTGRLGVQALLRAMEAGEGRPDDWKVTIQMGRGTQGVPDPEFDVGDGRFPESTLEPWQK